MTAIVASIPSAGSIGMLWYTTSSEKKPRRIVASRVLAAAQKSRTTCSALGMGAPLSVVGPPTLPNDRA